MNTFRWQGKDFGAWLMTIARNLTTDHFKAGRTRLEQATEDMGVHDDATEGPESAVLDALTNEVLLGALKELPTEQQECLIMRFLQGMSIAETAADPRPHRRGGQAAPAARRTQPRQAAARGDAGPMSPAPRHRLRRNLPRRPVVGAEMTGHLDGAGTHDSTDRTDAMTSVIPARRRAEEFAALVDGAGDASDHRRRRPRSSWSAPCGAPRPSHRGPSSCPTCAPRLMAEAEVALSSIDARLTLPGARPHPPRPPLVAIAAGAVALIGATTSMAVAAQNALPGDALYPIKRAIEDAQSGLTVDEVAKGEALLANASGRLDEVSALQPATPPRASRRSPDTLDDFSDQADDGADVLLADYAQTGDRRSIDRAAHFTASSMDALVELGRPTGPVLGPRRRSSPRRAGAQRRSTPRPSRLPRAAVAASPRSRRCSRADLRRRAPTLAATTAPPVRGHRQSPTSPARPAARSGRQPARSTSDQLRPAASRRTGAGPPHRRPGQRRPTHQRPASAT